MPTVNLVPNGVVLADHDLNHSFEKWRSQVDSSGFYIAVETDDQGHCLSVLASHTPASAVDLWACLPLMAHDPVRVILSPPAPDIRHRTLHVARGMS